MSILVVDAGTTSIRAVIVHSDGTLSHEIREKMPPETPADGLVEFDANAYATAALSCARQALAAHGPVEAVGVTNQRGTTVVWDRSTGQAVAPALGWQDLRTVGDCLVLNSEGFSFAPNQSATKVSHILDQIDPDRSRDLCFGTVDSWIVWTLTEGRAHVSDYANGGVTGLLTTDAQGFDQKVLERLRIPERMLPTYVPSSGFIEHATALEGAPPVTGLTGDQQGSLIGQNCLDPGSVKITFGTGAMLDMSLGETRPSFATRGTGGTYPIAVGVINDRLRWGIEGIMLSAGTTIDWLTADLNMIDSAAESAALATSVADSAGVVMVPALIGLGTPYWDYGARGSLFGLTRGVTQAHIVRATLEGIAERGADLFESAVQDSGYNPDTIRVDGGMCQNEFFVHHLARTTQRTIEIAPVVESTALGAGFLAGVSVGTWSGWDEVASLWAPKQTIEPGEPTDRDRWKTACQRAAEWYPELTHLGL